MRLSARRAKTVHLFVSVLYYVATKFCIEVSKCTFNFAILYYLVEVVNLLTLILKFLDDSLVIRHNLYLSFLFLIIV